MQYSNIRFWLSLIVAAIVYINPVSAAVDEVEELKKYVHKLIDDGYKIFNDTSISEKEVVKKSAQLIKANLDLEWMARYSLGRHRRSLSKAQINEFVEVYSKYIVKAYANLAKNYNGEKAVVKGVQQINEDMFMVTMEIRKPSDQSVTNIQYSVRQRDSTPGSPFKVVDIIPENVSLLSSQQAEFDSIIQSKGIEGLMAELKDKINKKEKPSNMP